MKGKLFILLPCTVVYLIAAADEFLEHPAVLLADGVDKVTVGVGDVHVPCAAAVPVEEVNSLVELRLRAGEGGFQVTAEAESGQVPVPLATGVEVNRYQSHLQRVSR